MAKSPGADGKQPRWGRIRGPGPSSSPRSGSCKGSWPLCCYTAPSTARLLQGSPYAALQFHAFGRFGAAMLWHLGPPMPAFMAWAGRPAAPASHRGPQHAQGDATHPGDVMVSVLGHVRAAGAHRYSQSYNRRGADDQKAPHGVLSLNYGALAALQSFARQPKP